METGIRRVAVISTGTEILQGLYADTNARYLCEKLGTLGFTVNLAAAAPDDISRVEGLLRFAASQADLIVCTGGLGPTEDDVNREAFARVFGVELVRDEEAIRMMSDRFLAKGIGPMPRANEVQAMVPKGARVFYNQWGTAPGYYLPRGVSPVLPACALVALPGPPKEMTGIFETCALPVLREIAPGGICVRTRTIHTIGIPESRLNEMVRDMFRRDPDVALTLLAKGYGVDVRVTARGHTSDRVDEVLASLHRDISSRVGEPSVYGTDSDTLQESVAKELAARKSTVGVAESCTGGLVMKMLTDVPGSSTYLVQGFVTYSNESKCRLLGVGQEIVNTHGAVSEPVARAMAGGVRSVSGTDYGLAITGIAGPDGGSAEKPVGLTYLAVTGPRGTCVERHRFLGDREQNRFSAAMSMLNLLRLTLLADR